MSLLSAFSNEEVQPTNFSMSDGVGIMRRRVFEVLERAENGDRLSLFIDLFLMTLIVLSSIAIILESVGTFFEVYETAFYWFEVFTVAVFSLEYALRFWCCVECVPAGSNKMAFRFKHMFSGAALIDIIAILPFYLMLGGLVGQTDMRFLRMFRLLRVLKLTRYSAAFDILVQAFKENGRSLAAAFFILLMVMLVASTGMYYFEQVAQPEAFSSIPASMWWAFATLTTVGYGDITPITTGGRVFGALITVLGLGMVALPTGILASAYTEQLRRRSERYRRQADFALKDGEKWTPIVGQRYKCLPSVHAARSGPQ
jgi:voltage-gated potassium channel